VLSILISVLDFITQHTIWLYLICLFVILFQVRAFALARRNRINTIFTIEREIAAHGEGRAMTNIGMALGIVVIITALKYYVVPTIDITELVEPTPTVVLIIPTEEPTPTPTAEEPTLTPRPRPTRRKIDTPVPPTATPLPPAPCPDPNTRITSPGVGAVLSGIVVIRGTANHGSFQFYKVEYGQGEQPSSWHGMNEIHKAPVIDGVLEEFDTTRLPNGVYWFQLTVVDNTGNFPPPCRVRVLIQN